MTSRAAVIGISALLFGGLGFGMGLYATFVVARQTEASWVLPVAALAFTGLGAGVGAGLGSGQDQPFAWSLAATVTGGLAGLAIGLAGAGIALTGGVALVLVTAVAVLAARR